MERVTFDVWDPADNMNTKESVIAYLQAALEDTDFSKEEDINFFLAVLNDVFRSKGMEKIAKELQSPANADVPA